MQSKTEKSHNTRHAQFQIFMQHQTHNSTNKNLQDPQIQIQIQIQITSPAHQQLYTNTSIATPSTMHSETNCCMHFWLWRVSVIKKII